MRVFTRRIAGLLTLILLAGAMDLARAATPPAARVEYEIRHNGEAAPDEGLIQVDCDARGARVLQLPRGEWIPGAPRETGYQDFAAGRTLQLLVDREGRRCHTLAEFAALPALEATDETLEILGLPCRKWTATLYSNHIELWSSTAAGLRGGPRLSLLDPDGLVLRILVNGELEFVATGLEALPRPTDLWPTDPGEAVDAAEYRARVTAGWVTTLPVFRREQVCFNPAAVDTSAMRLALRAARDADSSAVLRFGAGTLLLRKLTLPRLAPGQLFAELVERSRGDAYDRTGSLFLLSEERGGSLLDALERGIGALPRLATRDGRDYRGLTATPDYLPPLELLRFITPFGVGHYNEQVKVKGEVWADSVIYRMELSDLLPVLAGPVWIGAFVGNYDTGGHELSLTLRHHPGERTVQPAPATDTWCQPLFNTLNVLEMAGQEYGRLFEQDTLRVDFELPAELTELRLRYTSTGHGGWGGGDEFNPKPNRILLDGRELATVTPWRSDCAGLRSLNPASGNFWNGVSSSDLSRSGWCPGAVAEPVTIQLPELAPGPHRLEVAIPQGAPEGGSFSAWNVSGTLLGSRPTTRH